MALATSFMVFLFCSAIVYASLRCQWRSINNSNKSQTLDRVVLYRIEYKHDPAINWKWIVKPHTHRSNETKHFFFLFSKGFVYEQKQNKI